MKKYLLNCFGKILVKSVATKKNEEDGCFAHGEDTIFVNLKEGDTFYKFANADPNQSNYFVENSFLKKTIIKEADTLPELFDNYVAKIRGQDHTRIIFRDENTLSIMKNGTNVDFLVGAVNVGYDIIAVAKWDGTMWRAL